MIVRHDIEVPFVKGKKRVRFSRGHSYVPKETKGQMTEIRNAWINAGYSAAMKGVPVFVLICCEREMPKSHVRVRKRREVDVYYPDVDNIEKLVLDSLNGYAWADDKQVTMITTRKMDRVADRDGDVTVVSVCWEENDEVQGANGARDRVPHRDYIEIWERFVTAFVQRR